MNLKYFHTGLLASALLMLALISCQEKEYAIPAAKTALQNDVIKRSLGPNVAGLDIEFAYAMALGFGRGKITSASVTASIPGAQGTYMENRSFYTNASGIDVGVEVGQPSATEGGRTTVNFSIDTVAATLRYFYRIPENAKGQQVTFTFSAQASTGETVSYTMGPYDIAKMDMRLDVPVIDSDACFISIEDMAVYTPQEAAANPGKVDLVYLYRSIPNITFNHSLVSPAAITQYTPDFPLPGGMNKSTKVRKAWALRDQQLARLQFGIFIDDLDFQELNLSNEPDYAINMRAESGAWVETADGKYRAYIYFNSVNNTTRRAVVSIKRYAL